ncbi:MAG TPA: CDP-diacylglycerol--glycerol-3-phosphate 3-phosphatidyltransferase [Firmicutes bacterium]|nr:CDP-diacylglycerol--glycerol-3-phosphate 3-phosphatidyltransferase [Bacillota bacterium]HBM99769.1 CDP-diacylglycerol--glycerol-3-phosphate 3-phosphatidyltransferase [Bacillota bacterium]
MAYRAGHSLRNESMNIPTKITTARIALVVCLLSFLLVFDFLPESVYKPVYFGPNNSINLVYFIAMVVFVIASSTDFVDGYLARKWHQVTDLGKFLDPVADKLLVNSILIYLAISRYGNISIPVFAIIIMIARDLVVDALRFVAASKGIVLAANIFGKLKTVFQMVAIPVVLLNGWPFSYFDNGWNPYLCVANILIYLATLMSFLSGLIYLCQNVSVFKERKHD